MAKIFLMLFFFALTACSSNRIKDPFSHAAYSGPIIDFHTHVEFDSKVANTVAKVPATPENLNASIQESAVSLSGAIVVAGKGDIKGTIAKNNRLLEFTKKNSATFPIASVHPMDGKLALNEIKRLAKLGVKVLKLHPNTQKFDVAAPEVNAVVKQAGELGLIVLFDSYSIFDANQNGKLLLLAVSNPKAKIILAHLGGPKFLDMLLFNAVSEYPWYPNNVWFDLSWTATKFADTPLEEQLVWVARQIGVDRMLFGSDFPIVNQKIAIERFKQLGFTPQEQQKILYGNAAALLGIK